MRRPLVVAAAALSLVGCTSYPTSPTQTQGAGGPDTVALAVALGAGTSALAPTATRGPSQSGGTQQATAQLAAVNQSGLTGSATLWDLGGGRTRVEVLLTGPGSITIHPVGIYEGTCPQVGPTAAAGLWSLSAGVSGTDVSRSLSDLVGRMAIAVQKSPGDATVVACGNITRQ